jgi:4-amino-4-deoxy-L-arabinose transferase-like glycosyltransferase
MQPRINHQPTDRDKAPWKRVALFSLIAIWLFSGLIGRDPWKPDEPVYIGVLHSMLSQGGTAWWSPEIAGVMFEGELPFLHWINALIAYVPRMFLSLHEAARFSSAFWSALAITFIALACRRWSGGHISYLAAILTIGCVGLYDRAHFYIPDIAVFAAVAVAIYGAADLAENPRRATLALAAAIVLAFIARSALGFTLIALPVALLAFAPVYSMHRIALLRAVFFGVVLCAFLLFAFAKKSPEAFEAWIEIGAGFSFEDRTKFGPQSYLITLLWFAWPTWPIATWLVILRARGFAGGWMRGEVIVPAVFLITGLLVASIPAEPRTPYALYFLPSIIVLAAFGVDTLKRTWYAMIDWFGILVLGFVTIGVVIVSTTLYFKWPAFIAQWAERFVPQFRGDVPLFGYAIALLAFFIWIALIQPAHQHSRRALINWAGCVTFLWVVAQSLLTVPADYVTSYRGVFADLNKSWPTTGCVNSIDLANSQSALLHYFNERVTIPIDELSETTCPYVLMRRWKREPAAPPATQYKQIFQGRRPGDSSESFELYARLELLARRPATITNTGTPATDPANATLKKTTP